ncbi:Y-family DNA polymerase [Sphingobacterium hungaricum]
MAKRILSLWFPYLATDRLSKHYPELKNKPFVLSASEKGRIVIKAANLLAEQEGITAGKVLADARAIFPSIDDFKYDLEVINTLLESLATWCLRFTPIAAVDPPDGIMLDISGCAHLWGGEPQYLKTIVKRLLDNGYEVRAAIADTIGTAWGTARYGSGFSIVEKGKQIEMLVSLPSDALRLETPVLQRIRKLGFRKIGQFINMPSATLRRRFGETLLERLGQAVGSYPEALHPIKPQQPYQERLSCLEPIRTATGIEIGLQNLLESICNRMGKEGKGFRTGIFRGYRIDGKVEQISIGTSRASNDPLHLFKLFQLKIQSIEPALGIELFELEASLVEDVGEDQEVLWNVGGNPKKIAELLDNIAGKIGINAIHRYLPTEHHWPERSVKLTSSLDEKPSIAWPADKLRPLHLLAKPEPIDVMVQLPDYPPMLFTHKGKAYKLMKADGPERIEQEWWMATGQPRDYYRVEDENGARYWLFRSGHYEDGEVQWFLHGFFA